MYSVDWEWPVLVLALTLLDLIMSLGSLFFVTGCQHLWYGTLHGIRSLCATWLLSEGGVVATFFHLSSQAKKVELKECLINDMQEKKKAYEAFRLTGDLTSGGKV